VLADPLSPEARAVAELSGKRKKTERDMEELARREWMGGLYYDEKLGPVLPAWNVVRSIQEAARLSKLGKAIERGVFPEDELAKLEYEGPRDREEMWKSRQFAFRKGVKLSGRKIIRTRPIFHECAAEFVAVVDPTVMDFETFAVLASQAGRYIGVGDFRSGRYGRYAAVCTLLSERDEILAEIAQFSTGQDSKVNKTVMQTIAKEAAAHGARNGDL
jgi:hypothetical protein